MLKQWAISIGLAAGIAVCTSAIAGGEDCAAKQTRADKAVPTADKSTAQSPSTTTDKKQHDVATN